MTKQSLNLAVITNQPERAEMVDTVSTPLGWQVHANSGHMQPLHWLFMQAISASLDAVFIDLDLPNATQLVTELSTGQSQLPILALVAPERLVDLQTVLAAGAADFVALPVNAEHFTTVVERTVSAAAASAAASVAASSSAQVSAVPLGSIGVQPAQIADVPPQQAESPQSTMTPQAETVSSAEVVLNPEAEPNAQMEPNTETGPNTEMESSAETESNAEAVSPVETVSPDPHPPVAVPVLIPEGMREDVAAPLDQAPAAVHRYDETPQLTSGQMAVAQSLQLQQGTHRPEAPQSEMPSPEVSRSEMPLQNLDMNAVNANGLNINQQEMIQNPLAKAPQMNGMHGYDIGVGGPGAMAKRMIAVVGLRGGVGRSTIAVNLAMTIQQKELGNVTLVEAHHGLSHVSLMLHLHPRNTLASLADNMNVDSDIVRGHLQSHGSGINVLAAPSHFDDLVELSDERWATILQLTQEIAPIVVVDTSSTTDAALLETLVQATDIVVVMNPEIASLRSTTALVNSLYTEAEVQGTIHVVLNRAGVSGGLDEGTIRKQLGHELTATLPDDSSLATYAMNRGVPFVNSHARSLLTKRLNGLATQLVTGAQAPTEPKKSARSLLPFLNSLR